MTSDNRDTAPLRANLRMDISLIVATRNRASQLVHCLQALSRLRYDGPWELVLVDNGSEDCTAEILKGFSATARFPVRYVYEGAAGLGRARNAGLSAATGEVVGFTDDDCYPQDSLLQETVRAFADPGIGYAGGRILLFDPDDFPITVQESTTPRFIAPRTFVRAGQIQGANMAFRRRALQEIGGFDPWFGSGSLFAAEDVDALARVSLRGWGGVYNPQMVVFHHHGRKRADAARLAKVYAVGRGAYHMKLLVKERAVGSFLRAHLDLAGKVLRKPASVFWEVVGELQYLGRVLRPPGP